MTAGTMQYPQTRKTEQYDDYFGTIVHDPYRWLEAESAEEVAAWVREQNALSESYFEAIPGRDTLRRRIEQLLNYPRYSEPRKIGDRYFFLRNEGLQNQPVLCVQNDRDSAPSVCLDPNTFSEDGTKALASVTYSRDKRYLAYAVSDSGSDWTQIFVRDLVTGRDLPDRIERVRYSPPAWHRDGFFYCAYDRAPADLTGLVTSLTQRPKILYHRLGTEQCDDMLVYENPSKPEQVLLVSATADETLQFLLVWQGTAFGNLLYVRDSRMPGASFEPYCTEPGHIFNPLEEVDGEIILLTDHGAPTSKIVAADPADSDPANWRTIVPARDEAIEDARVAGGKLIVTYLKDASHHAVVYALDGTLLYDVDLPGIGSISEFYGRKGDETVLFEFSNFTTPRTIYEYDITANVSRVFLQPNVPFGIDDYITRQIFATSNDGTRVPMFVVHRNDLKLDGQNPTILRAYGGFNNSLKPVFSSAIIALLEQGGIFVQANVRGGGEYGAAWHEAGMKWKKQNVFDDFIAAAEHLFQAGYTSPDRLAIKGSSNGGLLVGAVMTQRPDICRVAFPSVGVLDMLRYHLFTVGWDWAYEYGVSSNPDEFEYLHRYSPLHNIKPGVNYPATLVRTADHDDRVVPAHSFKFTARLQECQAGSAPVLISVATKAGHGAGTPLSSLIGQTADDFAFLFHAMNCTKA
ncbi:MAG: prolyl oligopeptidase family serine peptidase [Bacteroidota bacterium]|nr:prolyl oligopeptidase family serine peptidase [Bacteroidota bacterium]MDP4232051.1 prolyl oligopeptidase family serine peptidase [Bacteroidota bacterium]MDP4241242.1 prolyl oligopeptidase family serine peptidase [Bacteroidota bacterium]MDP4286634.1 prolyl oligopeptidase family serine peptidase [Bacteroidota bacterium]